ncbi:unnamed protein product, partial [Ectocarpus sp. 12 AP-2014]
PFEKKEALDGLASIALLLSKACVLSCRSQRPTVYRRTELPTSSAHGVLRKISLARKTSSQYRGRVYPSTRLSRFRVAGKTKRTTCLPKSSSLPFLRRTPCSGYFFSENGDEENPALLLLFCFCYRYALPLLSSARAK